MPKAGQLSSSGRSTRSPSPVASRPPHQGAPASPKTDGSTSHAHTVEAGGLSGIPQERERTKRSRSPEGKGLSPVRKKVLREAEPANPPDAARQGPSVANAAGSSVDPMATAIKEIQENPTTGTLHAVLVGGDPNRVAALCLLIEKGRLAKNHYFDAHGGDLLDAALWDMKKSTDTDDGDSPQRFATDIQSVTRVLAACARSTDRDIRATAGGAQFDAVTHFLERAENLPLQQQQVDAFDATEPLFKAIASDVGRSRSDSKAHLDVFLEKILGFTDEERGLPLPVQARLAEKTARLMHHAPLTPKQLENLETIFSISGEFDTEVQQSLFAHAVANLERFSRNDEVNIDPECLMRAISISGWDGDSTYCGATETLARAGLLLDHSTQFAVREKIAQDMLEPEEGYDEEDIRFPGMLAQDRMKVYSALTMRERNFPEEGQKQQIEQWKATMLPFMDTHAEAAFLDAQPKAQHRISTKFDTGGMAARRSIERDLNFGTLRAAWESGDPAALSALASLIQDRTVTLGDCEGPDGKRLFDDLLPPAEHKDMSGQPQAMVLEKFASDVSRCTLLYEALQKSPDPRVRQLRWSSAHEVVERLFARLATVPVEDRNEAFKVIEPLIDMVALDMKRNPNPAGVQDFVKMLIACTSSDMDIGEGVRLRMAQHAVEAMRRAPVSAPLAGNIETLLRMTPKFHDAFRQELLKTLGTLIGSKNKGRDKIKLDPQVLRIVVISAGWKSVRPYVESCLEMVKALSKASSSTQFGVRKRIALDMIVPKGPGQPPALFPRLGTQERQFIYAALMQGRDRFGMREQAELLQWKALMSPSMTSPEEQALMEKLAKPSPGS